jgi:Asp-tRNA(Asn)/Glu-tRNA(Gln) amidotransferase A subunit family amidase
MLSEDTLYLTVEELGALLRSRQISPVELTSAYLERLERLGPKLGAVATITAPLALEQAREAEKEIAAGRSRGPLHGIPYGAKDLLATSGIPTTWGAPPFQNQVFDTDATVVWRLREAGAVLAAKLAMIELAGGGGYTNGRASLQGPSLCPFNLEHWAGGSSSGPGAAVPSALVGFAIGSETLGSIITPSAYSGCSGLRPTYGRVSRHGAMALSWTMDKLGPLCRSAVDCGLVLMAIAGSDAADATSLDAPFNWWPALARGRGGSKPLRGRRLGTLTPDFSRGGDPEVAAAFSAACGELRALGARVEETALPAYPYNTVAITLYTAEAGSIFRPLVESGRIEDLVDANQKAGLIAAVSIPASDYLDACRVRTEILPALGKMFETYDALVAPSKIAPAPRVDADFNNPPPLPAGDPKDLLSASNVAGLPAISVPCGFTRKENLPMGIQFVCDTLREDLCIELATAFQSATDWHKRRPQGL